MSEELQNEGFTIDAAAEDIQQAAPTETSENPKGAELATDTKSAEVETEVKAEPTEEEKEAKRQAAFNKQYGKNKQLERQLEAAEARNLELQQSQQAELPEVGNYPQEFDYDTDEEYKTAKASFMDNALARDRVLQNQNAANAAQQQQNAIIAQQRQEKFNTDLQSYTDSAKKHGIDAQELQQAANAVQSYGMTEDLSLAILGDADGPLLTKYLAANPQEVSTLVNMNPYAAGSYLANLKSKAAILKPKTSSTPKPSTDISGSGGEPDRDSPLIKGATFE